MFRLIARMMVKRTLRAHLNRDVEAILKTYSKDVRFRFPGNNSWAGEFRGIDQVRPWLQRFHRVGLMFEADEILIGGWPWNTKVALHFTDHLKAPDGHSSTRTAASFTLKAHGARFASTRSWRTPRRWLLLTSG